MPIVLRHLVHGKWEHMELYLFEDLLKAQSEDEVQSASQKIVEQLGYDHFHYGLAYQAPNTDQIDYYLVGTLPQQWLDRFFEQDYAAHDPSIQHSYRNTIPLVWTHRLFESEVHKSIHQDAIACGVDGGCAIPIHSPWLSGAGMLCLSSGEDADKLAPHVAETIGLASLLACYMNQALRGMALPKKFGFELRDELSTRELECLRWAAAGLPAKLIADKMGISIATVNAQHLPAIRRKLGVRTSREAVSIAIYHRLIQP